MRCWMSQNEGLYRKIVLVILGLAVFGLLANVTDGQAKERALKILATTGFSGPLAAMGAGYDRGMRMAIDEINEKGIKGFSGIEYKAVDTECKPSVMLRKLRREAQTWKPDIVFGAILETTIRVWCAELPKFKIPGFVGGHLGLTKYLPPGEVPVSKWVNYYGFPEYFSGYLAGKLLHEKGVKRVGFIAADYDWGYGNSWGLKGYWEDNGRPFEIVAFGYTPIEKVDLSTEVMMMKDAKLDAIYCPYTGSGWWALPKMLKDSGAMPEYFVWEISYSNMGSAKISGEYGAEGTYCIADHDPSTKAWRSFVKRWRDKYGEKSYPDAYGNNYYEGIYWAVKAFEKIGPDNKDPDKVVEVLQKTSVRNVNVGHMGPTCPYGTNQGAKGGIIQFVKGSSELDPSFNLHPIKDRVFDVPKMDLKQLLDTVKGMEKLERGVKYPAAK
jgi:ABC-type branched-subunit amino acid transport system substrate-binding protein